MSYFVSWIRDNKTSRFAFAHPTLDAALDFACEGLRIECSDIWINDENGKKISDLAAIKNHADKQPRPAVVRMTTLPPDETSQNQDMSQWDVFISHASEDKEGFVQPLAELFKTHGLKVWYDQFTMTVGDSLRRSIDKGLARSRFGIVVLSPDFLKKEWPQRELDGLVAREVDGVKVILPVWHRLGRKEVLAYSPTLADKIAASSAAGLENVANELLTAIRRDTGATVVPITKPHGELVAFGPNIVCTGEILSADHGEWRVRLDNFVTGDIGSLMRYAERFEETKPLNRYVIVNHLGDGRVLTGALSINKEPNHYIVKCPVAASAPRQAAKDLGSQMAISDETGDLFVKNGSIARVSGVESLPQVLRQVLSMMQGEAMFARDAGARLQEYFYNYRESPLLLSMLKLDIIRLAAIPYQDSTLQREHTPLHCIERVWSIKLLASEPNDNRIPMLLDLEVKGIGRKEYEVSVFVPSMDKLKIINT